MSSLRAATIHLAASLPQGSPTRRALAGLLQKEALLKDGPIGRVLEQHWNTIHDISHALGETLRDYGDAAHFMGGAAEKDAKEMIKHIEKAQKALNEIATDVFSDLVTEEGRFIGKHGEPGDYSDAQRNSIFPRAASAAGVTDLGSWKDEDGKSWKAELHFGVPSKLGSAAEDGFHLRLVPGGKGSGIWKKMLDAKTDDAKGRASAQRKAKDFLDKGGFEKA